MFLSELDYRIVTSKRPFIFVFMKKVKRGIKRWMILSVVIALEVLIASAPCFSQQSQSYIEQLNVKLETAKDSARVIILQDLAWEWVFRDIKKAQKYTDQALKLAEGLKYEYGVFQAVGIQALIHYQKSEYDLALKQYLILLRKSEEYKDKSLIAKAYTNIGNVYNKQGQYKTALEYYEKSYRLKVETNERKSFANSLINIGGIYYELGEHDKGAEYFKMSLPYAEEFGNIRQAAIISGNLGLYYRNKGDLEQAETYYLKSIDTRKKLNDLDGLANIYLNLGSLYTVTNDYEKSENILKEGLEITTRLENKTRLIHFYRNLAQLQQKKGEYQKSYDYAVKAIELSDSLHNGETAKRIAEMQAKYDNEKKQKEIELLKKEAMLTMFENDRKSKEIEILNGEKKLTEAEAANKSKTIELLTQQKKLQEIEKQKDQQKIALMSKEQLVSDLELRKNRILIYSFSALLLLIAGFSWYMYKAFLQKKKSNLTLARQNEEIFRQKEIIEEKNENIVASINYARLIQDALLPKEHLLGHYFSEYFVLYLPKDIVSGDFFWIEEVRKKDLSGDTEIMFSAVDCTGHGVPGAFMSIVGYNSLNKAIKEYKLDQPRDVLNFLNNAVNETLGREDSVKNVKDGMDLALCSFDPHTSILKYAGAFNPLWVVRNDGSLQEIKADKMPIGSGNSSSNYQQHELSLDKGDSVFIFSDGYADQFGGSKGKKYKYSQMKEVLLANKHLPFSELKSLLSESHFTWKGNLEQVDDILVMGVKV